MRRNLFWKVLLVGSLFVFANSFAWSGSTLWPVLEPVIQSRVHQKHQKMKLQVVEAEHFKVFLENLRDPIPKLKSLQLVLPKVTVELLMAVSKRGLDLKEAERMADYLKTVVDRFRFSNLGAFDENTSHIIGREWSEIDYSGENITWQKQKAKYQSYGINHFKSLGCLKKYIPVESKLPYFDRIYRPRNIKVSLPTG